MYVVHTQNSILFSHKEQNPAIWDNMDGLEGVMINEIVKEKGNYRIISQIQNLYKHKIMS